MARRIELPSADVLFADAPAVPPSRAVRKGAAAATPKSAPRKRTTAAPKSNAGKKPTAAPKPATRKKPAAASRPSTRKRATATSKPSTRKRATPAASAPRDAKKPIARTRKAAPPRPRTLRATPVARLEYVEDRLADMPVDALIDLRDGLEELLAADVVDEAAVRRLLDAVEV